MNIVEKTPATSPSAAVDFDRFRLRRFVESLPDSERETHDEPLDLADVAPILEGNARAVLFHSVGPERQELVANVAGGRTRLALAFGVEPRALVAEIQRRLRNKPEVFEVPRAQAPAQQVVLTGDEADLTKLPVHLGHGADGGPYISASVDFVVDPRTGLTNVGMRRLMLRGRRETGIDLVSPSDLRAIYEASAASRQAAAGELCGRRPPGRSGCRHDAAAGRRAWAALSVARCTAAGGQVRHQRHPRAGRRRMGARGLLSTRAGTSNRKGRMANSSAITARSSSTRCSTSPPSRAGMTRCSRPRPSAAARSAAPTPRNSPDCAPR